VSLLSSFSFKIFSLIVIGSVIEVVMNGLVLFKLWGWFIHPNFMAPALSFWQAVAIGLLVTFMTKYRTSSASREGKTVGGT
jgi:steroid 5-alpha reductase family enzyme